MITSQFETDHQAQTILTEKLPSNWLFRKQDPDFYIDYVVELEENSHPSGLNFAIQLKGTTILEVKRGFIRFKMMTQHLEYYLEKARQPVFLIVVDVVNRECYFLFIQEFLKSLNDNSWKRKKKLTLKISTDNRIQDINAFRNEVIKSDNFVRDMWPSSILASIVAKKNSIKNVNPHIEFDLIHQDNKLTYVIKSKDALNFTLNMSREKAVVFQQILDNVAREGITAHIDGSGIKLVGFDFIIEQTKENDLTEIMIGPAAIGNASAMITSIDRQGGISSILPNITGKLFNLQNDLVFEGELENGPLALRLEVPHSFDNNKKILSLNVKFEFERWFNKSVIQLPFIERLYNLLCNLQNEHEIKIEVDYQGKSLLKVCSNLDDKEFINSIHSFLELVYKTSIIAAFLKTDIILPNENKIKRKDYYNINLLYDIIVHGKHIQKSKKDKINIELYPIKDIFVSVIKNNKIGSLRLTMDKEYEIFDQNIVFGSIVYEIREAKLLTNITNINIEEIVRNKETIKLEWEAVEDSEVIISRNTERI